MTARACVGCNRLRPRPASFPSRGDGGGAAPVLCHGMPQPQPPAFSVTISQVAEAAGVSRATVSRAFGRPEMLSVETVRKIRAVAQKLGYSPNHTARALSTGRSSNIALVVPDVANPFFPPLIRAAQEGADAAGFCVFLGNSDENPKREDVLLSRIAGQVDGIVLCSSRLPEARIRAVAAVKPLALVNRDVDGIPRVLIDTAGGVRAAVRHLAELGHERLAYVAGPPASWSNLERKTAAREAARKAGMELTVLPTTRPSFEAGRRSAPAIQRSGASAVIAFDDLTAQGVLVGLAELGLAAPADISVVGCDDVLGHIVMPPLTTVSSRCREAGETAVKILLEMLGDRGVTDVRYVLDTELIVRGTTGRARA